MNKPKVVVTAGAVLLSAALAVTFFLSEDNAPVVKSSEVYTWDCEYPEQKPEAITLTCADGGQYIDDITWDTWSASGAQGTGFYHVNDCDPNCAEGNFLSAPVTIQLSDLSTYQGKSYLRTMTFETTSGENLPNSGQSIYQWDVMEFAEMMGE
jgi:hypothetical protein